jgi:hypothetical protein
MRFLHAPVLAALIAALTTGCRSAPPEDANNLVLRTYDVPKGSARSVVATLSDTFWVGEQQKLIGRASITPDGRLAVLATPNVQVGDQSLVDDITKHPPNNEQLDELHYFVVLGKPAATPLPLRAGVMEIQPALDEIARSQGPQTFTLAERVRLSSLNGNDGKVETEQVKISQKAGQTNEGVDARIGIQFAKNDKLETRVHLDADRIVVLGATSQHSDAPEGSTLYYVVRVTPRADGKRP